jgi:hypothetical protein
VSKLTRSSRRRLLWLRRRRRVNQQINNGRRLLLLLLLLLLLSACESPTWPCTWRARKSCINCPHGAVASLNESASKCVRITCRFLRRLGLRHRAQPLLSRPVPAFETRLATSLGEHSVMSVTLLMLTMRADGADAPTRPHWPASTQRR